MGTCDVRLGKFESADVEPSAMTVKATGNRKPSRGWRTLLDCVMWCACAIQAFELGELILGPVLNEGPTQAAIVQSTAYLGLVCGVLGLGVFYDHVPVSKLPVGRWLMVNSLLCVGGVLFFFSFAFAAAEMPSIAVSMFLASLALLLTAQQLTPRENRRGASNGPPRGTCATDF